MSGEITLLVNPAAGRGNADGAALRAARVLRGAGFLVRGVVGEDARDAVRRARAAVAGGTGALIAVGGDGIVSLALQAVAGTGTPLGIVPAGTGNDTARACGLPLGDPDAAGEVAAAALKAGTTRALDLGRVGESWFASVLASGFDSRVNDRGNRMRHPRGRLRYDLAMVAELAGLRTVPYRMRLDDGPWREIDATLIAVGNGPSYGGGMRICAGARLDDGLFDITVVGEVDRRTLLRVFPRVYRGTHLGHPAVSVFRAARVTLEAPGVTGYADGEPLGRLPLTAECVRGAVRLLAAPAPGPAGD
ncbi:diacylglycerol kinase [Streptomyces litchfieldiae]|uniref:Diacylglycerol kinase n=1 Tax=Streptomyces litchfieldiae TaxID=3075543 RepID=A0ABU2MVZ2_9ACTN|nr:diacylglycerol kinase [Streptomyces sp. DSM 44938]MDT0345661.1 diacylglycerol kinase [Streptomyces sp. DSM 44938]